MKFAHELRDWKEQRRGHDCPVLNYKQYKKLINKGRDGCIEPSGASSASCEVCEAFFAQLESDIAAVDLAFRALAVDILQRLSGRSRSSWCCAITRGDIARVPSMDVLQAASNLADAAKVNCLALTKLLKKYDKVHGGGRGRAFLARQMHLRGFLSSSQLDEIRALAIAEDVTETEQLLMCPVCFDAPMRSPRALSCGHHLCHSCVSRVLPEAVARRARLSAAGSGGGGGGEGDGSGSSGSGGGNCPVCRQSVSGVAPLPAWEAVTRLRFPEQYSEQRKAARREKTQRAVQTARTALRQVAGPPRVDEVVAAMYTR